MKKPVDQLKDTLHDLESELNSLDPADSETRALLENTVAEIQAILGRSTTRPADEDESTVLGLKAAIERFETSHPTLTGILSRLVDALGQMGI